LYPSGFNEESCISRYESLLYHSWKLDKASPYLISKLRSYEARHKRCVELYNTTVLSLSDCKYIVWISSAGLGNKMMTISSTFLYALLTDRVMLVDRGNVNDISELFCEPFPGTSWYLRLDFPLIRKFGYFKEDSPDSFGNLLKQHPNSDLPFRRNYVYLHMNHDFTDNDQLFFCDQHQAYLRNTPWLFIKSNAYFIPSLFSISSFEQELNQLFPDKEIVFHLLGRYLFHPTNEVWALVSRYYDAYLSKADVRVGIHIRITRRQRVVKSQVLDQILSCSINEGIFFQLH
ncbi:alpha-1,2-fucosyltransferase, partial [Genlisea aurea]